MAIKSEIGRGLIYAGDTPLVCTITVEQTGPMRIVVRAGIFTTTGQARILDYDPVAHDPFIADGRAETLPDGKRVRIWLQDKNGAPIDKAATHRLGADQVIDVTSDPQRAVAYKVDLFSDGAQTDVLVKRKVIGIEQYGDPPPDWQKVHELLFAFGLPPACADITPLDIYALTVKPGFPDGTGPSDWTIQAGVVRVPQRP
jgi:hypothetical protein